MVLMDSLEAVQDTPTTVNGAIKLEVNRITTVYNTQSDFASSVAAACKHQKGKLNRCTYRTPMRPNQFP